MLTGATGGCAVFWCGQSCYSRLRDCHVTTVACADNYVGEGGGVRRRLLYGKKIIIERSKDVPYRRPVKVRLCSCSCSFKGGPFRRRPLVIHKKLKKSRVLDRVSISQSRDMSSQPLRKVNPEARGEQSLPEVTAVRNTQMGR